MTAFDFRTALCVAALSSATFIADAPAQDQKAPERQTASWPQWRGPDRDGIYKATDWSPKSKEKSVWFTNVGLGYSMVSIQDGRIYTIGHDDEVEEDTIYCIDPATGFDVWTHSYKSKTMGRGHRGGCLTTPSIAGGRVYVANREGRVYCLDAKTGKEIWSKDLLKDHGMQLPRWGFSASPVVLNDMIVQSMGRVFAFDRDGKLLWKTEKDYGDAYSTPATMKVGDKNCVACFNGQGLVLIDRLNGAEVAMHPFSTGRRGVHSTTPVISGNRIFITSGQKGCQMLEVTEDGLKLAWESREMRSSMATCVIKGGHIYGLDSSTFKCLDMDGNVKWSQRGFGQGAFGVAGDRLVILSSRGDLVIAKASPKGYEELSRRNVLSGGNFWTAPVVCGGMIYARNSLGDLVCLDHRKGD